MTIAVLAISGGAALRASLIKASLSSAADPAVDSNGNENRRGKQQTRASWSSPLFALEKTVIAHPG